MHHGAARLACRRRHQLRLDFRHSSLLRLDHTARQEQRRRDVGRREDQIGTPNPQGSQHRGERRADQQSGRPVEARAQGLQQASYVGGVNATLQAPPRPSPVHTHTHLRDAHDFRGQHFWEVCSGRAEQ